MSKKVNFSVMCHAIYQSEMSIPDEYCESRESILEYIRENLDDAPILEIEYLLRENLESHAIPKLYKIRNSFPLTPNGKRNVQQIQLEKDGFVYIEHSCIFPYSF